LLRQKASKRGKKDKDMKKNMLDLYSDYLISSFGGNYSYRTSTIIAREHKSWRSNWCYV